MKKVIIFLILFLSNIAYADQAYRFSICKETANYFAASSSKRNWNEFRIFAYSAEKVAKMFPMYPADNDDDRILRMYCMGANESLLEKNYIHPNVPGVKYSTGKVRRFSLDYDWAGLNEHNIDQTYYIAKAIQNGKPIPKRYSSPKLREILKGAHIPKNIKLKKIDKNLIPIARERYAWMIKHGYKPNSIYKAMLYSAPITATSTPESISMTSKLIYSSYTQDDIDSALIYRVIEELERYTLGWDYGLMKEDLFQWLNNKLEK